MEGNIKSTEQEESQDLLEQVDFHPLLRVFNVVDPDEETDDEMMLDENISC
jgi:hypothetical protein